MDTTESEKFYLWDNLLTGWVHNYDSQTGTYNIYDAQIFTGEYPFDEERYVRHDLNHAKGFGDFKLVIVHDDFLIGHRTKYKLPVNHRAGSFGNPFNGDPDYNLVSKQKKWAYRFDFSHPWNIYDSHQEALQAAKKYAIREMTCNGHHYINLYSAYVDYLKANPDIKDDHLIVDKNENEMYQLPQNRLTVGSPYHWRREDDKRYVRRILLRHLITKQRYGITFSRGYRIPAKRQLGRLTADAKEKICKAMAVFDQAYVVEVAGIAPSSPYLSCSVDRCILGGVHAAMSGVSMVYYLLFRADIDGKERVLLPEIPLIYA